MLDFTNSIILNFQQLEFEDNIKCAICNRKIKNVFTFLINNEEIYIGTECTKTIALSKKQLINLNDCKKIFKNDLTQIKKLQKAIDFRKNEFNNIIIDIQEINIRDFKFSVKIIAPSRYNSNELFTYNSFFFKSDLFKNILK